MATVAIPRPFRRALGGHRQRPARQRGATLVEFVVVFPMAVLFVLGLIQFGLAYMAKLQVNHATFMAARAAAMDHASTSTLRQSLAKGLNIFYERGNDTDDSSRIGTAAGLALADLIDIRPRVLNPSDASFKDFGLYDPVAKRHYIPNDNLEFRSMAVGATSHQNIRDANLLKLEVTYGYEMKVPIIAGIVRRIMCGGSIGIAAWDGVGLPKDLSDCPLYYMRSRLPIRSYAIVEMQSRAERP